MEEIQHTQIAIALWHWYFHEQKSAKDYTILNRKMYTMDMTTFLTLILKTYWALHGRYTDHYFKVELVNYVFELVIGKFYGALIGHVSKVVQQWTWRTINTAWMDFDTQSRLCKYSIDFRWGISSQHIHVYEMSFWLLTFSKSSMKYFLFIKFFWYLW